ncbi:MAG: 5-formyltetrahydrofolate cyclo-ligase [Flavobacteriaceae bacterium]|nr:5-formyltetrahydrofolate cyclo-ligase [Flavobacteriaceae bacterium]
MTKTELRKKYLSKRKGMSSEEKETLSLLIANRLLELDIWDFSNYHIFLSINSKSEINTEYILNILAGKDKNIIVPKTDFVTNSLKHYLLTDNTLIRPNSYGIPEPQEGIEINPSTIDVVFVPLLCFDKRGHRVGYGKGFYDRFLKECKNETIKIGLSFFEAEEIISGVSDSDIAIDYCVTPESIHKFDPT